MNDNLWEGVCRLGSKIWRWFEQVESLVDLTFPSRSGKIPPTP